MQTKPPLDEFPKPSHLQTTDPAGEMFSPPGPVDYTKDQVDPTSNNSTGHCQYSNKLCRNQKLHGFRLCHKHILADRSSPYCRCSAMMDGRRCQNPAPKEADRTNSYCLLHEPMQKPETRRKKRKGQDSATLATTAKKKPVDVAARDPPPQRPTMQRTSASDTRASQRTTNQRSDNIIKNITLQGVGTPTASLQKKRDGASSDDELHFEASETDRIDCIWQGSQDSEGETTDSEDENPLNHAGTWTLEEAIQMCRDKMIKLKELYTQQYKRVHQVLRSERGKMVRQFDMDPAVLAKVPIAERTGSMLDDYEYDTLLSNYQRPIGLEILLEKASREKKNSRAAHANRRNDLARCQSNQGGHRCQKKVLPYSKFCRQHICSDLDQYLYSPCSFGLDSGQTCALVVGLFQIEAKCSFHATLLPRVVNKGWENLRTIRQKDKSKSMLQKEGASQATDSVSKQSPVNDPAQKSENDTTTDGMSYLSAASVMDIVDRLSPAVLLSDVKLSTDTTRAVNSSTDAQVDKKLLESYGADIPTSHTTVKETGDDGISPQKKDKPNFSSQLNTKVGIADSIATLPGDDNDENDTAINDATLTGVSDAIVPPATTKETKTDELSSPKKCESNPAYSWTGKATETVITANENTPLASTTDYIGSTSLVSSTTASILDGTTTTTASILDGTTTTTSVRKENSDAEEAEERVIKNQGWFTI